MTFLHAPPPSESTYVSVVKRCKNSSHSQDGIQYAGWLANNGCGIIPLKNVSAHLVQRGYRRAGTQNDRLSESCPNGCEATRAERILARASIWRGPVPRSSSGLRRASSSNPPSRTCRATGRTQRTCVWTLPYGHVYGHACGHACRHAFGDVPRTVGKLSAEAVTLSTGTPMTAHWTGRRRWPMKRPVEPSQHWRPRIL